MWDRCNDFGCLWGVGDDGGYGDGSVNALCAFNIIQGLTIGVALAIAPEEAPPGSEGGIWILI